MAGSFRRRSISAAASSRRRLCIHSRNAKLMVRLRSACGNALQQAPDVVFNDDIDAMRHAVFRSLGATVLR